MNIFNKQNEKVSANKNQQDPKNPGQPQEKDPKKQAGGQPTGRPNEKNARTNKPNTQK